MLYFFQTPNSYFIYTVRDPSGCFAIDRHSGVLKLAKPLDREKAAKMRLEITTAELEDSLVEEKPHGASVTVNIDVTDANDNAPVFVPRMYTEIPSSFSLFDSMVSQSVLLYWSTRRLFRVNTSMKSVKLQ